MKEKILDYLKSEGFVINELDPDYFSFDYEGLHLLLLTKDSPCITFVIPGIFDEDDAGDKLTFYQLADVVNSKVRFVKCYTTGDSLSLSYETKFKETDDVEARTDEILDMLPQVTILAHKHINGFVNGKKED